MHRALIIFLIVLCPSVSRTAAAQGTSPPSREIAVSVGPAYLSHGDDGLGWGSTIGAALTVPLARRFGLRFEGQRAFGPDLFERSCTAYPANSCSGIGHYGARDLTIWTGSGIYYFAPDGVQPYVVGGLDVLHFSFLSDVTFGSGNQVRITEHEQRHTTMGVALGAGVRLPVGTRLFISPAMMIHDGTILAGANLTQLRTSVAIGYRF